MSKSPRRKRGRKRRNRSNATPLHQSRSPTQVTNWTIGRMMIDAQHAYLWGDTQYALDILMEIAQEEINDHVKETFNLSCQPRPKKSTNASRASTPSHSQGATPIRDKLKQLKEHLYGGDDNDQEYFWEAQPGVGRVSKIDSHS